MSEFQHPTLLNREAAAGFVSQHYGPQLGLLNEMTNYASNLIPRAYSSSAKQLPDLIVCFSLLKQFAGMLDAIEILLRAGAVHASFVPARAAFEVSLYLEWMLVSDTEKKAIHYYVGNIRAERIWGLRVQRSTSEASDFLKDMGQMGVDILANRPALDQEGASHVAQIERILSLPEFASTNKAFENHKKKAGRRHEPEWYKVLGKANLKEIARELNRLPEYVVNYSKGSSVTHSQSYKDQLEFKSAGVGAHPIRNLAELHSAFNFAFTTSMLVFHRVLGFYRSEELMAFWKTYASDWRQAFINIPTLNIES